MEDFISLDLDADFVDSNFSALWDPTLKPCHGPSQSGLYKLAYLARKGDRSSAGEFADAMSWTLREESFESFQRIRGHRPIPYPYWFYFKLHQFVSILLYEEIEVFGLGPLGFSGKPRADRPWQEGSGVLTGRSPIIQMEDLEQAFRPEDGSGFDWHNFVWTLVNVGKSRVVRFQKLITAKRLNGDPGRQRRPVRRAHAP